MKIGRTVMFFYRCLACFVLISLVACSPGSSGNPTPSQAVNGKKTYKNLVVGFAQVGAESEWRNGNTQ